MPQQLSATEEKELKDAFNALADGDDKITVDELKKVFECVNIEMSDGDIQAMFNCIDKDGSGKIDFNEFKEAMVSSRPSNDDLKAMFDDVDKDGSGTISKCELKKLMSNARQPMSNECFDQMFSQLDTNGDGTVNFEEFQAMMQ